MDADDADDVFFSSAPAPRSPVTEMLDALQSALMAVNDSVTGMPSSVRVRDESRNARPST